MRKSNKYLVIIGLLISVACVSCNFGKFYERAEDIPKGLWDKGRVLKFDVPVTDTLNGFNISLNVRNNNNYRYSNLYLYVKTTSPKGFSKRDTVEMILADDKGKWLGSGLGGIVSLEKLYKNDVRFPVAGTYRIEIMHGMRNDVLEGIMDVGVKIEKVD